MSKHTIATGEIFGRWTVVSLEVVKRWHALCRCVCGVTREVMKSALNNGTSTSCGCARNETNSRAKAAHGRTRKDKTYNAWSSMKARCSNTKHPCYQLYGGRGISVCGDWSTFEGFIADMGESPVGSTLERLNTNLGYSSENCEWLSHKKNCQNTRQSKRWHLNGQVFDSSTEAARALGIASSSVLYKCDGRMVNGKFLPPQPGCWSEPVYR